MKVTKRDGKIELYNREKIKERVDDLCKRHNINVDVEELITLFEDKIRETEKISTFDIDKIICAIAEIKAITNNEYSRLNYILIRDNQIKSIKHFLKIPDDDLFVMFCTISKISKYSVIDKIDKWSNEIRETFSKYQSNVGYVGYRFIMKKYSNLIRESNVPLEIPEFIFMRVSLMMFDKVKKSMKLYKYLCLGRLILGSSILFNAGISSKREQFSNCFVVNVEDDNKNQNKNIYKIGLISASGGGIGVSVSKIREKGAYVNGGGKASGVLTFLRSVNKSLIMNSQHGKRPGNASGNIEMFHPEVLDVINDKNPHSGELTNVFPSLWISDHFMRYVIHNKEWKFLKIVNCSHLVNLFDKKFSREWIDVAKLTNEEKKDFAFTVEYEKLASNPENVHSSMNAVDIIKQVAKVECEVGTPYTCSKDEINRCNMQESLGTIEGTNLCAEIMQKHDKDNIAVCNIGSVVLPNCIDRKGNFSWYILRKTQRLLVDALNNCIDKTFYPVKEARVMNMKTRPISCGIQGLADLFVMHEYAFDSEEAFKLNQSLAEFLQYVSLERSCELAKKYGKYETFDSSPYAKGIFHHEKCREKPEISYDLHLNYPDVNIRENVTLLINWNALRQNIMTYGLRNSLLIARMPTVSTSIITGASPGAEPYTGIIYKKKFDNIEFILVNKFLLKYIDKLGLNRSEIVNKIILSPDESVQNIEELKSIKHLFKTAYEIDPSAITRHNCKTKPFICQSSSVNYWFNRKNGNDIVNFIKVIYNSWIGGAKTWTYYSRFSFVTTNEKADYIIQKNTDGPTCSSGACSL